MESEIDDLVKKCTTCQESRPHGLPRKVVTDNGPSFTSTEFQDFMSSNGVKLVHSAPYHPSTNGLAERAVQSFKKAIKRIPGASVQERLLKYVFKYRIYHRHISCRDAHGPSSSL